jgi:hypothetical protein
LERILTSAHFRSSRRYPALLQYVVEKTLSGNVNELKERTLGVEVFHRAPDYDTNADPVVRFSASEVRRRIAQYYRENATNARLEISLPVGSYVPQFLRTGPPHADPLALPGDQEPAANESGEDAGEPPAAHASHAEPQPAALSQPPASRRNFLYGALAGLTLAAAAVPIGLAVRAVLPANRSKSKLQELWAPILSDSDGVLIEVGRTHVEANEAPQPPNATIEQHILRPQARISLAAVQAISQVAGFLQAQHHPFSIHEAYTDTLQDLHRHPVILVSGFNNPWTMRLLRPLRFYFEQTGTLHSIIDSQHPERRDWSVDFDTPYLQQTADYAVVGRFFDATTSSPVVVIAGIGSNGSQAAGEFVVSANALDPLAQSAPHGTLETNFLAVLRVEVIAGNTGSATIVATHFW